MKKILIMASLALSFFLIGMGPALSQEQPKPKKDTVNIDTDAKPVFYYAAEDEKSQSENNSGTIVGVIAGIVVIAGAAGFFFMRKKKG
jgi:LPXTG-motif cell wall-anchored protein